MTTEFGTYYLDPHLESTSGELSSIESVLLPIVTSKLKRVTKKYEEQLHILLCNLLVASRTSLPIRYSRSSGYYTSTRYNKTLSFKVLMNCINKLHEEGYIGNQIGKYSSIKGLGVMSEIIVLKPLSKLLAGKSTAHITHSLDAETVVLKDNKKCRIDYVDTKQTQEMRGNLKRINSQLSATWIDIDLPKTLLHFESQINFTSYFLQRIFNKSSFESGGRFYGGWWQSIPSDLRKYITISGKRVREYDYSGISIRMLYAKEGLAVPAGDVYELPSPFNKHRSYSKLALQVIINAKGNPITAFNKALRDKVKVDKEAGKLTPIDEGIDAKDFVNAISKKHTAIKKHFGSGIGVDLQYLDSRIAEKVILRLLEDNITALPIHDSFLVRASHHLDLAKAMQEVYFEENKSEAVFKLEESLSKNALVQGTNLFDELSEYSLSARIKRKEEWELAQRCPAEQIAKKLE